MSYEFCSKFYMLSSNAKIKKNQLRFDKVTESSKVGTFLRHSVCLYTGNYVVHVGAFVVMKVSFIMYNFICVYMCISISSISISNQSSLMTTRFQ